MSEFSYKGRSFTGNVTSAVITAPDLKTAMSKLKSQKMTVIEINEVQNNVLKEYFKKLNILKSSSVKPRELVLFSRQFSTLVTAGVPIVQGLGILIDQASTPEFKNIVVKIREDIEQGISITDALKKHPDAFSELYVAMIRAGEVGGILDVILERLSSYLEASEELKSKVKGALIYPAVVSSVAATVTLFLLVFVIPTFQGIFESFGQQLPLPTRFMIALSGILRNYFFIIAAVPFAVIIFLRKFRKTEKGHILLDSLVLKLPLFGMLLRKVAIAKFSRTLGTLVKSGVPILQALDTVAKTSGNKKVEMAIDTARLSVKSGERMSEPMRKSDVFPPMVVQMIAIGEETGNLDSMLSKIADFYDQEVDASVKALTSMIEPLIMVGMGILIGAIVLSMFLPMFELGNLASEAG